MDLYRHAAPDPALDVAISHALLERAVREGSTSVRVWRPIRPALSLGRLDARGPERAELLELVRAGGATPVRRLAGGRAALAAAGCLCLGWALPDPVMERSSERYREMADLILVALAHLGIQAELGEAAGEWCPGSWSVQGPDGKLAGLAQRVIRRGAWCEALIVVERSPAERDLIRHVHRALSIPWRARAQGELVRALPGEADPHARLAEALVAELTRRWPQLAPAPLPPSVRAAAARLRDEHLWP